MKAVKDIILQNWGLKLTALLLAVVLWLGVHGDPGTERTITVPLEIHNQPRNLEITSERPSSVQVTIRGGAAGLLFGQANPTCIIDLSRAEEGDKLIPLGPENLRIPRGVSLEVIAVRPVRIHLSLERIISKEVPIVPLIVGEPAAGYEKYGVTCSPVKTVLIGPRSRVEAIREVVTEHNSIQGLRESLHLFSNLNIRDSLIHSSPSGQVEVNIQIGVRRRRVTISRIHVLPDDNTVIVIPADVSIQVLVPEDFGRALTSSDFTATVSARKVDLTLPRVKVKPDVSLAHPLVPGIQVHEVIPPLVTLHKLEKS
jgi:YbbR domain-containing protein